MKKITHRWQRKSCLVLFLLAMGQTSMAKPSMLAGRMFVKPVAWTISGKVTTSTGEALPGVTVLVKGTSNGTATGPDGSYSLSVPETAGTLVASFIGYTTQEKAFNGPGTFNITLLEDAKALEEVVVVGYGTQRKEDLTGAVTAITSKDFNPGQISSPEQLISGRVAGVQITSGGGAPGSGSKIRIRGGASLNASNDPLIVVDGVPLDNNSISGSPSPLSLINPNDIESFNILKDASATAIYGSRASNGVIIITTKKGKEGDGFRVGFSTVNSISEITETLEVLQGDEFRAAVNQYATAENKALLGTANTDWQSLIYQKAFTTDNNLTFSGAFKSLPYRLSLGYLNQDGVLKTSNLERKSVSVNLNPSFLDNHLSLNLNLKGSATASRFANEGAIGLAASFDPTQPVYKEGSPYGGFFEWTNANGTPNTLAPRNPLSILEQTNNTSDVKRTISNLQVDYKFHFLPELHFNVNIGVDYSKGEGRNIQPATLAGVFTQGGSRSRYEQTKLNKLADTYLNYTKEVAAINSRVEVVLGRSYQSFNTESPSFASTNTAGDIVSQAGNPYEVTNVLIGYFGRLNYAYKNKYLLTTNFRADASSRFSEDIRWGYFPSVALGWRIVEEPFMQGAGFFSDLKLRAGYGKTGQQDIGGNYYPYLARYAPSNMEGSYQFGNQFLTTLRPAGYDNTIQWENTETYNGGLDFGFAENRVTGSLNYYYKQTNNLIASINFPAGSNLTNELATNVGTLENRGVEAEFNFNLLNTERTKWSVGLNGTYNENEVINLSKSPNSGSAGYQVGGIGGGVGNTIQIHTAGYPRNSFYVYKQVYDENGQPIELTYADLNRDGVVNAQDLYRYQQIDPKVFLGFNTQFNYGKFNAGFTVRASFGNYVYNNQAANAFYNNVDWTGYLLTIPASVRETNFVSESSERLFSDYFVENASFLRMDNANIGYNVGKIYRDKANLRLTLTGQNLLTVTKYSGLDPEIGSGIGNTFYPRPRTFAFGVNLDF